MCMNRYVCFCANRGGSDGGRKSSGTGSPLRSNWYAIHRHARTCIFIICTRAHLRPGRLTGSHMGACIHVLVAVTVVIVIGDVTHIRVGNQPHRMWSYLYSWNFGGACCRLTATVNRTMINRAHCPSATHTHVGDGRKGGPHHQQQHSIQSNEKKPTCSAFHKAGWIRMEHASHETPAWRGIYTTAKIASNINEFVVYIHMSVDESVVRHSSLLIMFDGREMTVAFTIFRPSCVFLSANR